MTDGAASKFLQPDPGVFIASKAQQLLEVDGINSRFTGGEPPHGFIPVGDWFLGAIHDGSGRQRKLVLTLGANIEVP